MGLSRLDTGNCPNYPVHLPVRMGAGPVLLCLI